MIIRTFVCRPSWSWVWASLFLWCLVDGRRQKVKPRRRSERPNIVLLMTDDQDTELGNDRVEGIRVGCAKNMNAHIEAAVIEYYLFKFEYFIK